MINPMDVGPIFQFPKVSITLQFLKVSPVSTMKEKVIPLDNSLQWVMWSQSLKVKPHYEYSINVAPCFDF